MAPRRPPTRRPSVGPPARPAGGRPAGRSVESPPAGRSRRRGTVALAATVIGLGVLLVAALPTNTYLAQRRATRAAQADLLAVKAERERVKRETERLTTAEEIEKRARREFGFQKPGEETYNVLPAPAEPIGLPDTWPFAGVERALGAP